MFVRKSSRALASLWLALAALPGAGRAGDAFLTNSLGWRFVRVEPGAFQRPASTAGPCDYDERPLQKITIRHSFYISTTVVGSEAYTLAKLPGSAADVSWQQAAAFCAWLGRTEGRSYRLPTEAEWKYVFSKSAGQVKFFGREWVQDWHGVFPPGDLVDPLGPVTGTTKVICGGPHRASLSPDATGARVGCEPIGFRLVLLEDNLPSGNFAPPLFCQSAVKQNTAVALQGPDPSLPYFTVRFALPVPPDNDRSLSGPLAGLDPAVMAHNHSPGFEILPNGDALAIYFSARNSSGSNESATDTRFVQARLRYGAEEWDLPELFCDFKPLNDQSGLLWKDGNTVRFFGGGRGASPWLPFKMGISTNNGASWTLSLPILDKEAQDYTAQPIVNAFRSPEGALFFPMDAAKNSSFLWRSTDQGIHWHDRCGRTGGRHSTIVLLDSGELLAIGGKSTSIEGWSPQSISSNWGRTWSEPKASPFPALASNQRPCLIRLANGHLCFVSDSYNRKTRASPKGWKEGAGCIVAISKNQGKTWRIKRLPVELPHEADRKFGTLGYATVRQAPNGVIHVLATMTDPCLHYEFNEAWVFSDAGDLPAESSGGAVREDREWYPGGQLKTTWSARICAHGRYLLEGPETSYYQSGRKEHEVFYKAGRKTGQESFWAPDGTRLWTWNHDPENHSATWTQYWTNGRARLQSRWNTSPRARDLDRRFAGLVADGPAYQWNPDGSPSQAFQFTNGVMAGKIELSPSPTAAAAPTAEGSQ